MRKSALKSASTRCRSIPYLLIVGDKEVESRTVAVRTREGADLGTIALEAFCDHLQQDVSSYGRSEANRATQ